MFSKLLLLIVISVLVVFFPYYALLAMQWVMLFHAYVADFLSGIFSDGQIGLIIRDLLGMIALPVLVGLLFGLLNWIFRRKMLACFSIVVWSVWLLQLGALILLNKV